MYRCSKIFTLCCNTLILLELYGGGVLCHPHQYHIVAMSFAPLGVHSRDIVALARLMEYSSDYFT
jgi:hypothetical protein